MQLGDGLLLQFSNIHGALRVECSRPRLAPGKVGMAERLMIECRTSVAYETRAMRAEEANWRRAELQIAVDNTVLNSPRQAAR
jgi:hypothetical protein